MKKSTSIATKITTVSRIALVVCHSISIDFRDSALVFVKTLLKNNIAVS